MVDLVQLRTQGRLSALPLNVSFEPVKQKKRKKASCWRLCDLTIPWVSLGLYDRVLALFAEIARCSELHV